MIETIPGTKPIVLKNDYRITLAGLDSDTGVMLLDCLGDKAVLVSDLLENLPSDVLREFLGATAIPMVLASKGLANGD